MNLKEDVRSVTYMKSCAADLLDQVNRERRPVVITQNGEPRAVMLAPEAYDRMRTAIGLLKLISQGEQDIRSGRSEDQDSVLARLARKYQSRVPA